MNLAFRNERDDRITVKIKHHSDMEPIITEKACSRTFQQTTDDANGECISAHFGGQRVTFHVKCELRDKGARLRITFSIGSDGSPSRFSFRHSIRRWLLGFNPHDCYN
jgi:hypothetical protein